MVKFLIIISVIVCIALGALYGVGRFLHEDGFFLLRKKQFKKNVLQRGYERTWDVVDSLMETSEKEWKIANKKLMYEPFPQTRIVFEKSSKLSLTIYEGTGQKEVFHVQYAMKEEKISGGEDFITGDTLKPEDVFRMKHVLLHVNGLFDTLTSIAYQKELHARLRAEATFFEMKADIKAQLLSIINQDLPLEGGYRRYGFLFQFKKEKHYQALLVSFDDVLYFQALQMEHLGAITTTMHNEENQHAQLFTELEKELVFFAKKVFKQHPLHQKTTDELYLETFEDYYKETLTAIQRFTTDLGQESEWLSVEAMHYIHETLPNDLKTLTDVYRVVNDKKEVRSDVEASLQMILEKLKGFYQEAERNKQLAIKKSKLVIGKR